MSSTLTPDQIGMHNSLCYAKTIVAPFDNTGCRVPDGTLHATSTVSVTSRIPAIVKTSATLRCSGIYVGPGVSNTLCTINVVTNDTWSWNAFSNIPNSSEITTKTIRARQVSMGVRIHIYGRADGRGSRLVVIPTTSSLPTNLADVLANPDAKFLDTSKRYNELFYLPTMGASGEGKTVSMWHDPSSTTGFDQAMSEGFFIFLYDSSQTATDFIEVEHVVNYEYLPNQANMSNPVSTAIGDPQSGPSVVSVAASRIPHDVSSAMDLATKGVHLVKEITKIGKQVAESSVAKKAGKFLSNFFSKAKQVETFAEPLLETGFLAHCYLHRLSNELGLNLSQDQRSVILSHPMSQWLDLLNDIRQGCYVHRLGNAKIVNNVEVPVLTDILDRTQLLRYHRGGA